MKSTDDFAREFLRALSKARRKHPDFAVGAADATIVIKMEVEELDHAVAHESEERQEAEAMDVVVTAARLWMGEHK